MGFKKGILLFAFIFYLNFTSFGQPLCTELPETEPCFGLTGIECTECLQGTEIPIDGGVTWLLLGGLLIGIKRIRSKKQKV